MRIAHGTLVAAGVALAACLPLAGSEGGGSALSEARLISAALESVTGLTADFTQTIESEALPSAQIERGVVSLLRPGRMRFEYSVPRGKLAIADGHRTWLYLPEDRQVVVAPIGRGGEAGMDLLLMERIDLPRLFAASWEEDASGRRWLALTPHAPKAAYQRLLVRVTDDHLIRELRVLDALGGRITYRFERMRRTDRLDPGLFEFVPPPGVVVQEAPP